MARALAALCCALVAMLPMSVRAQGAAPSTAQGHRLFIQNCAVCHVQPMPGAKLYGPALNRATLGSDKAALEQQVRDGSPNMPGFRYDLAPAQVDAIIDYLETVAPPPPNAAPAAAPAQAVGGNAD